MKVVDKNEFFRELKKYPVEMGFIRKDWVVEIFNKIEFSIPKEAKNEKN